MRDLIFSMLAAIISLSAVAQGSNGRMVEKTIPVKKGQTVRMKFDYPELIKVTTWDKQEVSIQADVDINSGENNDAFVIESSVKDEEIAIDSKIKDLHNLPHRITVQDEGKRIIFNTKTELKEYQKQHGKTFNSVSYGVDMDIHIQIYVPANVETHIESVYGMVEVKDFDGPLNVEATYGGVDASIAEKSVGTIEAETNYGEIFTNLSAKFSGDFAEHDFYTNVKATPGSGPSYSLESKYGNVYIRKADN